jgi:Plasmid pRiA4b ORF-3-like protein.
MSETLGLQLTCAQRLVASDLLPELVDSLMLDTKNERTISLTQKQIERLRDAALKAIRDAPTGTMRNSLRHIVDKSSDILTRESAAQKVMRPKVTLVGSDPPIWRRIETHDCSLATLHDIIQVAMGWEDYHLLRFQVGQKQYGTPDPMDADFGIRLIDERRSDSAKSSPELVSG